MTTPVAEVRVDRYSISCLPIDHPEWAHFSLFVVYRRNLHGWVVTDGVSTLDRDGRLHARPEASATYPDEVAALAVAQRLAAVMTANGTPVIDVLAGMRGEL